MATATAATNDQTRRALMALLRFYGHGPTDAAERTGISRATIHNWLGGRAAMSRMGIGTVATAYDVPTELFTLEGSDVTQWLLDHKSDQFDDCMV